VVVFALVASDLLPDCPRQLTPSWRYQSVRYNVILLPGRRSSPKSFHWPRST